MSDIIQMRIHDRMDLSWLTPSQKQVWENIQRFNSAPHRVINIYGGEGTGKTFMGWLFEQLTYSTYCKWPDIHKPLLRRLTLDDIIPDRPTTRNIRPLVDTYGIQQIILLSRIRVDEKVMPAFELRITEEDMEAFRANLYRHFKIVLPEEDQRNYKEALESLP
jgi:hypothetical protein